MQDEQDNTNDDHDDEDGNDNNHFVQPNTECSLIVSGEMLVCSCVCVTERERLCIGVAKTTSKVSVAVRHASFFISIV